MNDKENWFNETNDHFYDESVIQFASADNFLFLDYKKIIGSEHLTPKEAYETAFGKDSFQNGTVISVVLFMESLLSGMGHKAVSPYAAPWFKIFRTPGYTKWNNLLKNSRTLSQAHLKTFPCSYSFAVRRGMRRSSPCSSEMTSSPT
jgi:hypothetical protein